MNLLAGCCEGLGPRPSIGMNKNSESSVVMLNQAFCSYTELCGYQCPVLSVIVIYYWII